MNRSFVPKWQLSHGAPTYRQRHAGDLGNIVANQDGVAEFTLTDKFMSLVGGPSIIGRSLVIDQDEDDYSLAADRSLPAAACGIIGRIE